MRISIITVTYNAEKFLESCIRSVISQTYPHIEYIIVDGGSTDASLSLIHKYQDRVDVLVSEKDAGIYDAMNKGIALATGDVIGFLNADDFFADDRVIEDIAAALGTEAGIVYGDLLYVNPGDTSKVVRKWVSSSFSRTAMAWGWMPAHPTFYAPRKLYHKLGGFNLKFNSAADYDLMLRFLYLNETNSIYLDRVFVKMRTGGISNRSVFNRLKANYNDMRAMQQNKISWPWFKVVIKPLRKISQYINLL